MDTAKWTNLIFVPTEDVDEETTDYYELVGWGHQHIDHPNVLLLEISDIYLMEDVWWIVNDENHSRSEKGRMISSFQPKRK
ncbi:hypothetical protein [Chitinophaga pinensis]|uniref:Uncharacterized protein n=1 Tax=Chitinophaga pinensis (strain ATCC 43595 / DSM 2588 / LMG 13176 / NBRC 15968 / NCIMB 11800 / UQM 2034) TaxID=485918 RepID=A0A979G954_CHIPD|nr:hypothetical protein [Chitinophaga pinensis]ACU63001.1 hypothetical protein Cpin_5574 [Chitinophaga pinensis DSM 2588]